MKKILSLFAVMTILSIGQGAFAWTFDGLGSLNPFTNFGRGFGNSDCGCEKPKLSKCDRVRMNYGKPTGYAAPVIIQQRYIPQQSMPVLYEMPYSRQIHMNPCTNCHRAF